jgi:hypothetical protein
MQIFKVSFVVPGRRDIGGIQNLDREPRVGDKIAIGRHEFEVIELMELMPPRGEFVYLHATCKLLKEEADQQ